MTVHTIKQDSTTLHTVDVPTGYAQPASDGTGTSALRRSEAVIFRVYDADGSGTSKSIGGKTFYSTYSSTYFESDYIVGVPIVDVGNVNQPTRGYGTTAYYAAWGNFGSTTDSQSITLPGVSNSYTIETMHHNHGFAWVFGVNPDDEVENPAVWSNYNFILTGNGSTHTIDGSRLIADEQGNTHERWRTGSYLTGESDKLRNIFQVGQNVNFKIQRK